MCIGFALGHLAPASLSKESLHEAVDVSGSNLFCNIADFIESLVVMFLDRLGASLEIREGMTVRGKREFDAADFTNAIERIKERLEWIGQIGDAADMRRDRGQDVIA